VPETNVETRKTMEKCDCCGGWIPAEGSEMWNASDGECPGSMTPSGLCGAFDDGSMATRVSFASVRDGLARAAQKAGIDLKVGDAGACPSCYVNASVDVRGASSIAEIGRRGRVA